MKAPRLLALLVCAGVSACALLPKHHPTTTITPVSTPVASEGRADDGYYAGAVRAVNARDYATALDALEMARQQDGDDIRVLNAFGVVYDKLGRFDVSAHFYALAAAIDPASRIVQQNVAYSALLQGKAGGESGPALASAAPKAAPVARLVEIAPGISRLDPSVGSPALISLPRGITGHPLALVDASGGRGIEPVRIGLRRLGWSASRLAESSAPAQPHSEIIYPTNARPVALALARTLPAHVDMVVCAKGCHGVQLVLGDDVAGWGRRSPRDAAHRA
jgi:hypothetical protein